MKTIVKTVLLACALIAPSIAASQDYPSGSVTVTMPGGSLKTDFDLQRRPIRHPVGQNLIAARRLIEAGVRLVSVHAFTGFDGYTDWPPVVNVWDMHAAGGPRTSIFGMNTYGLPFALPRDIIIAEWFFIEAGNFRVGAKLFAFRLLAFVSR